MRKLVPVVLVAAFAAGCGTGAESEGRAAVTPAPTSATSAPGGATSPTTPSATSPSRPAATGTTIVAANSQFGTMLFDARKQAIYLFTTEDGAVPACYGECARAWPPVTTANAPVAGTGVRDDLLGTTKRTDGTRQVTYGGHPLYYYAHEGPGQVLCHDVPGFGGQWLVLGPDGNRRP